MKQLLLFCMVFLAISCKSYTKESIKENCKHTFFITDGHSHTPENEKLAEAVCDCVGEKVKAQYPTKSEADKNSIEVMNITKECNEEYLKSIGK